MNFLGCFQCNPPTKAWRPEESGTCLQIQALYIGTAVPNVVIDAFLLLLSLPIIKGLNTAAGKRLALAFIFILGYSVAILSIARLVVVVTLRDTELEDLTCEWLSRLSFGANKLFDSLFPSGNFVTTIILVTLEPSIALISVCFPAHAYLIRHTAKHVLSLPFISSLTSLSLRGKGGAHLGAMAEPIDPDHQDDTGYMELEDISTKKSDKGPGTEDSVYPTGHTRV